MGRVTLIMVLAWLLLVTQPQTASPNFLAPLLSPIQDEVCKGIECGKGKCKPSGNLTFMYECECDPGWKQAGLSFLPCVIPNCSIDYSCAAASPPVQDKETNANKSIFEPCHWMDCGGGMCNTTSFLTYKCECHANYYNLLNVSAFPCFQDCSIGMDCKNVGIALGNQSATSPPSIAGNTNQASSLRRTNIGWLIMMTIISSPFLLK